MHQIFKTEIRVMEAETIQKNAARPKSHTSRRNFMRFAVLAIALGAIVFAGCSKDDDDGGSDSNSSLVGEWDWPEEHVTFTFSADGKWSAYDYEYAHEDCSGTYIYDEEKTIIYLTYVPATDEPIWGRRWELRNDISSILKVEVYDEDGYQGTMTLTRKKQ